MVPDQKAKSIGHEETFARDHHRYETLHHELVRLGDSVATRLRAAGVAGRTVTIKVRFNDFTTITRAVTLPTAVDTGPAVINAADQLLQRVDPTPGVRLLGIHVSQLVDHAARQLTLDDVEAPSWADATDAVDAIRARYGADAIVPATLAGPEGIRVKRRGDQQWGPTRICQLDDPELTRVALSARGPCGKMRGQRPWARGEGTVPLSEDEERILSEIAQQFYADDPEFARGVGQSTLYRYTLRRMKWSGFGFFVGMVFLVATLPPASCSRSPASC